MQRADRHDRGRRYRKLRIKIPLDSHLVLSLPPGRNTPLRLYNTEACADPLWAELVFHEDLAWSSFRDRPFQENVREVYHYQLKKHSSTGSVLVPLLIQASTVQPVSHDLP